MLYWVTQTFTSSAPLYWETMHSGVLQEPPEYVSVPTGVARYPKEEVLRFPRSWVEQRYNVTHWADMPRGGHFAAMEQPELFVDDLRTLLPDRALTCTVCGGAVSRSRAACRVASRRVELRLVAADRACR